MQYDKWIEFRIFLSLKYKIIHKDSFGLVKAYKNQLFNYSMTTKK